MVGENRLGNVVLQMLLNWEFTHAKPRQEYGVESLRSESPDAGRGADAGGVKGSGEKCRVKVRRCKREERCGGDFGCLMFNF